MNETIKVTVTGKEAILPIGRKAIVQKVGLNFLVLKAETKEGKLKSTNPMTLWLRENEFKKVAVQ